MLGSSDVTPLLLHRRGQLCSGVPTSTPHLPCSPALRARRAPRTRRRCPALPNPLPQKSVGSQLVPHSLPWGLDPEGCLQYSNYAATFTSPLGMGPFTVPAGKAHMPETCACGPFKVLATVGTGSPQARGACKGPQLPPSVLGPGPPVTSSPLLGTATRKTESLMGRSGVWDFQQIGKDRLCPAARFLQDHPPLGRKRGKKGKSLSSCFCFS